jgi:hypothetical protein
MTVISFDTARRRPALVPRARWQPFEVAELMRLFATLRERGRAVGFDYGETDHGDPQFYLLCSEDGDCVACISRLAGPDGRCYVAQDEVGAEIAEPAADIRSLVAEMMPAAPAKRSRTRLVLAVKTVAGALLCSRAVDGHDLIGGTLGENVAAWTPLLLAVG